MTVQIRPYHQRDEQSVVELSVRAWAPVFASMKEVLGHEIFFRLHGDWRHFQATGVRKVLADSAVHVAVAVDELGVAGFVAAKRTDPEQSLGEIWMLAVDPDRQNRGVGTALTRWGTDWLRSTGIQVAMIGTGGDPGHAPARRVYEAAGYTPMPLVRYFKAL